MKKFHEIICASKMDFITVQAVQSHISILHKIGILDYYKCRICGNYHTNTIKNKEVVSQKRERTRTKRETQENRIKKMR